MLKQEKSTKCGIEIRCQAAGWDNEYLLKVIGSNFFMRLRWTNPEGSVIVNYLRTIQTTDLSPSGSPKEFFAIGHQFVL